MHTSSRGAGATWRRLALVAGAAVLATALSGCPLGDDRPAERSAPPPAGSASAGDDGSPVPSRGTDASTALYLYDGPPEDGPPSAGPVARVAAAVDLTAVRPGVFSRVEQAVPAAGGRVHVVLTPVESSVPPALGTVGPTANGPAVTSSVDLPRVDDVWGLHALPDGQVAVTGPLRSAEGRRDGFGAAVVDPVTGATRTTVVVPHPGKTRLVFGRSALSPDGRTLYLFVSVVTAAGAQEELFAVDLEDGRVTAQRDLAADVAAASASPAGHELTGMVALPRGGVTLVLDASPDATRPERIPTLLTYTAWFEPVGGPVRVTSLAEDAQTQAVAGGVDGTAFLVVRVGDGGAWVMAVPPGGGAGPVLAQIDDPYDYALVVEPAQVWGVLPARDGARPVDLTSGELGVPVDVGCPGRDVRGVFPGTDGAGAVMVGECNSPRTRTQMLWIVRP